METITTTLELDTNAGEIADVVIYADFIQDAAAHRDCYGRPTECATAQEIHLVCIEIEGQDYTFEEAYEKFFNHETSDYITRMMEQAIIEQAEFNFENDINL